MPRPYPKEFRDDVVAIARRRDASFAQVAKDFGIYLSDGISQIGYAVIG